MYIIYCVYKIKFRINFFLFEIYVGLGYYDDIYEFYKFSIIKK